MIVTADLNENSGRVDTEDHVQAELDGHANEEGQGNAGAIGKLICAQSVNLLC